MAYERLVALNVLDEAMYSAYRERMTPLLHAVGGSFRFDARVSELLTSDVSHAVNRVFVIRFPSLEVHQQFFADPAYLEVRREFFEKSVQGATPIATYEV